MDDPRHLRPYAVEYLIAGAVVLLFTGLGIYLTTTPEEPATPQVCRMIMPEDLDR